MITHGERKARGKKGSERGREGGEREGERKEEKEERKERARQMPCFVTPLPSRILGLAAAFRSFIVSVARVRRLMPPYQGSHFILLTLSLFFFGSA